MKHTFNQEHIIGILCIAIGSVVLVLTKQFPGGTDAASISGPAFFPNTLSYILIALGFYEILHGIFGKDEKFSSIGEIWEGMKTKEFLNLMIITVLLIIYILTVELIGFFIMSAIFLFIILWRLGVRPIKNVFTTIVFLVIIWLVFSKIFTVSLPTGILF